MKSESAFSKRKPLDAYFTTKYKGFKGPNNCGATCAMNWLKHCRPEVLDDFEDRLHNQFYRQMRIGRFGAHLFRFSRGFLSTVRTLGLELRPKYRVVVGAKGLARLVEKGPVALCMLANRHYGWHWVLVLDTRRTPEGSLELLLADGWKKAPLWVPYKQTGRIRQAVEFIA